MVYAQINDENICVAVSDMGDVEAFDPQLIKIDTFDTSLLGKRYNNGVWEIVPTPPDEIITDANSRLIPTKLVCNMSDTPKTVTGSGTLDIVNVAKMPEAKIDGQPIATTFASDMSQYSNTEYLQFDFKNGCEIPSIYNLDRPSYAVIGTKTDVTLDGTPTKYYTGIPDEGITITGKGYVLFTSNAPDNRINDKIVIDGVTVKDTTEDFVLTAGVLRLDFNNSLEVSTNTSLSKAGVVIAVY